MYTEGAPSNAVNLSIATTMLLLVYTMCAEQVCPTIVCESKSLCIGLFVCLRLRLCVFMILLVYTMCAEQVCPMCVCLSMSLCVGMSVCLCLRLCVCL